MRSTEEFERELAVRAAPALLGIKPANLLTIEGTDVFVSDNIMRFNARAEDRGLRIIELKRLEGRTLMLLSNDRLLNEYLIKSEVREMFGGFGYGDCYGCRQHMQKLRKRMAENGDFPHEVGLFLGYPAADVKGFIENKGRNFLLCGYWKVYHDAENALRTFRRYDGCVKYMRERLDGGRSLYSVLKIN